MIFEEELKEYHATALSAAVIRDHQIADIITA
mgnify:FL=1|jgi:hypothetical protein